MPSKGLFQYSWIPVKMWSVSSMFQRFIKKDLAGYKNLSKYMDIVKLRKEQLQGWWRTCWAHLCRYIYVSISQSDMFCTRELSMWSIHVIDAERLDPFIKLCVMIYHMSGKSTLFPTHYTSGSGMNNLRADYILTWLNLGHIFLILEDPDLKWLVREIKKNHKSYRAKVIFRYY